MTTEEMVTVGKVAWCVWMGIVGLLYIIDVYDDSPDKRFSSRLMLGTIVVFAMLVLKPDLFAIVTALFGTTLALTMCALFGWWLWNLVQDAFSEPETPRPRTATPDEMLAEMALRRVRNELERRQTVYDHYMLNPRVAELHRFEAGEEASLIKHLKHREQQLSAKLNNDR